MEFEVVIGLEVHAQLSTETKLFCGCSTRFGSAPNTQCCPVCLGLPGVLPVVNRNALELALKCALALDCKISEVVVFDRKNYYYPDLPKNYQISQNYQNLGTDGKLLLPINGHKVVRIHNVHLEEDAGKLIHPEGKNIDYTLVDLNRTGTPLVEIVTEPDLRSVGELETYMDVLVTTLRYLEVSDCKMQEGSLRLEASISLREKGSEELGNRVEIKNLNSFRAVLKALEYEVERQGHILKKGDEVARETRLWNEDLEVTQPMRTKELAHDYRYFPEPDLVPIRISQEWLEELRASIPELPHIRKERFIRQYSLPDYDASILTESRYVADFFEECSELFGDPKAISNWVLTEVLRYLNEHNISIGELRVSPGHLVEIIKLQKSGKITNQVAKHIFRVCADEGKAPSEVLKEESLEQVSDEDSLRGVCSSVIEKNEKAVSDYLSGKKSAVGFLVGQVMRETRGKANPQLARKVLLELLENAGS